MFDVRLVDTFVALATYRHFGKAAAALNATQPGVSQHVARLERQLGVELFARSRRSVELTPAGLTFLEHTRRLLPLLRKMEEDTRRVAAGLMGRVTLGLSSSVIYSDVPARISAFTQAAPGLDLGLQVHGGDDLKRLLDWGEIDAIISTLALSADEYWSVEVSVQPMGVALPASHPLAIRSRLTLDMMVDEAFIVVPREQHPTNNDALISRFRDLGAQLRVAAYDTSFPNVLARVAVGQGVALVAMGYQGDHNSAVRVIALDDPLLATTPIYAVARRDNLASPTRRLIEGLCESADLPTEGETKN